MEKETQVGGEAYGLGEKVRGKALTLEGFLGRKLTEEEAAKIDSVEMGQRTYASTLDLEELKLYKFTLEEEIREVEGEYGPSHVVEVLNGADGQKYSVWLPTVLGRKLRDCKAGKGVTVGVVYKGIPKGKRYKDFAVFVWTPETEKLLVTV
jgi:hypothetical protein